MLYLFYEESLKCNHIQTGFNEPSGLEVKQRPLVARARSAPPEERLAGALQTGRRTGCTAGRDGRRATVPPCSGTEQDTVSTPRWNYTGDPGPTHALISLAAPRRRTGADGTRPVDVSR